jgi:CheY-like chemotaxis protein/anti-sigma regulatory factor (Ser/Thr protein kinase)
MDEVGRFTLLGHDLRAAISDVLGGLRLIKTDTLDEAAKLQIERVRVSGEELARLLEEGMSFMPDESAPGPSAISTAKLLKDLEMRWSGRAREKGLSLQIAVAANAPRRIAVDRVALDRALSNILSNAIKFTARGEIRLDVSSHRAGVLDFCVRDQGDGFSPQAQAQLWQPQSRAPDRPNEGEGLGLHICKQMVERLGATITVRNMERGAQVAISVPVTELEEAGKTALPDLRGMRVLIAEDSETNQAILAQMLEELGAKVSIANDGIAALDLIDHALTAGLPFALALVDIEMPRLGGLEVIRALRKIPDTAMPIVAVTAYVLRSNRAAIFAAGADAIMSKPLETIYIVGDAILKAQAAQGLSRAAIETPQIDLARFDRLLVAAGQGTPELLRRLMADLKSCERKLIASIAVHDLSGIRAQTHILMSVAGAVGAVRLQALATALNAQAHLQTSVDLMEITRETLNQIDLLIQHTATQLAARQDSQ